MSGATLEMSKAPSAEQPRRTRLTSRLKLIAGVGYYYAFLYLARRFFRGIVNMLERRLIAIEQRKALVEPWTVLASRLTTADNRKVWNEYNWTRRGEEWTRSEEWRNELIATYIDPYFKPGQIIVEIGPGGGRWTEILQKRAEKLFLVDVADAPLALCRERFPACANISYLLSDGKSIPVPDESIDAIWSYECFVHINPLDVRNYFREFQRVLRPGGRAVIHHAGPHIPAKPIRPGMRSDLTDQMVKDFAQESRLDVVLQTTMLVNPGDVLTIVVKPIADDASQR